MKKIVSLLLALALVLCSVGAVFAEAAAEPVKMTFWTFQDLHINLYQAMLDKWNADPTKTPLEIDFQPYPFEDMHTMLNMAIDAGEGLPDIVDIEIGKFANYLGENIVLAPMNDYVEPIADHLVMARLNNYAKDGKYYGIDHHIGATVMFYNAKLLEDAGIDYTTIATWDDFHEAGKVFLEKTGKPMITFETTDCWSLYPMVNQHGGDWLTLDNQVRMDEPVVIDTMKFMQSMLEDGTAIPTPGGMSHTEEYYGWMDQGGCAAICMPFWYLDRFVNYMPDLAGSMKIAPMPTWADGGHKSAQMGGTGTAVIASSPNAELAKEFVAYVGLTEEGCVTTWKTCGYDPILKDVYGTEAMKETNKFFEFYGQDLFEVLSTVLDDIPDTCLTAYYPAATDIVKSQMAYRLVELKEDPEQIAKDCAEELRAQIE